MKAYSQDVREWALRAVDQGRPRAKKRVQLQAWLEAQLRVHNDATLEQHCEMWEQAHGEPVSRWTMSRAIKHLGWTRKKSCWVLPSATKRSGPPGEEKQAGFQQSSLFFLMSVAPTLL